VTDQTADSNGEHDQVQQQARDEHRRRQLGNNPQEAEDDKNVDQGAMLGRHEGLQRESAAPAFTLASARSTPGQVDVRSSST